MTTLLVIITTGLGIAFKKVEANDDRPTYEVIRKRLQTHARELSAKLEQLNQDRRAVFGSIETELLTTERVTTSNNCVPRDLVAVGNCLLLGYNVLVTTTVLHSYKTSQHVCCQGEK